MISSLSYPPDETALCGHTSYGLSKHTSHPHDRTSSISPAQLCIQPWPLISEHPEYTWHKDCSAGAELPVSSRSFTPSHCFCSWPSVWDEFFRERRPILVRFRFFKNCSSEKYFTSPGCTIFTTDRVRLFNAPFGLAINNYLLTTWHRHSPRHDADCYSCFWAGYRQRSFVWCR